MIYGASGYTGRLALAVALARGHRPVLGGRNAPLLAELARPHGLEVRVFGLDRQDDVRRGLAGIAVVLHAAGPFSRTSRPLLDACLVTGTHYLDITGEIDVLEAVYARTAELAAAGVVAVPGVGFDVVPSDCLAVRLKEALPEATRLRLALMPRGGRLSPGTLKTAVEGLPDGLRVRRDGRLVQASPQSWLVPPSGRRAVAVPWGDLASAFLSTGIPDIETYADLGPAGGAPPAVQKALGIALRVPGALLRVAQGLVGRLVKGPTAEERARSRITIVGRVETGDGRQVTGAIETGDGYGFTAESAVRCVERLLATPPAPGAYTPTTAFGPEFALEIPGCHLVGGRLGEGGGDGPPASGGGRAPG